MNYTEMVSETWRHRELGSSPNGYRELVRYATLAASSHNTQPWIFKLEPNQIQVLPDLSRRCPAVDPDDHHLYASLGCATENLLLAARAAGLKGDCRFDASKSGLVVDFEEAEAERSALFEAIPLRQCSRSEYDGVPLTPEELELLQRAGEGEGVTATALFDLSEADAVFRHKFESNREEAIEEYRDYMAARESESLKPGTGFYLVKALLSLDQFQSGDKTPLVEVVVMSRNSPETGVRVFHNIREYGLNITRSAFTGGESVVDYLDAYDVDLFLTTNTKDAQRVIDSDSCAVALVKEPPANIEAIPDGQVRIAFDGDAVLFSDESEIVYKAEGLKGFHSAEDREQDNPLNDGPYATLLRKLSRLQDRLPHKVDFSPVRVAIITARNSPAEMRVIKTLRHWGVYVDEIFFLGGLDKSKIIKAFKAHIFFDDQDVHLEPAARYTPAGKVPYRSGSPLKDSEKQ